MPNKSEHLEKANHNEKFFQSLDVDNTCFRDWIVVGIFYCALHLIDSYFAESENKHPPVHSVRDRWIRGNLNLENLWEKYRELKEFRKNASYEMHDFSAEEIKDDILPLLENIKEDINNLLSQQTP